jgi:hypothetical protein
MLLACWSGNFIYCIVVASEEMNSSSPCCPPNSEKFLAVDYIASGFAGSLPDGTEFYAAGNPASKNAILVIPDVYGIHGGR